jgi:colicin import membrane protein
MTTLAGGREAWLPQAPRDMGLGALLALLAHAGLIVALAMGLNWRNQPDAAVMSAELWSALPQLAAPAAAPPPAAPIVATPPAPLPVPSPVEARPAPVVPPPVAARPDAQIAIEKAERAKKADAEAQAQREAERARQEATRLKQQKARDDKARDDKLRAEKAREDKRLKDLAEQREAQAADARIARQREDNLKRMLGQAGATGAPDAAGQAARDAAPSAAYAGRIKARIKPNIVLTAEVSGNPVTEIEVKCAPDGQIVGRRIVKASGNATWDDTVLRAIDRTDGLPRDVDGRIPATMILVFPRRE